jgi:chromosome segregation ATPase
MWGLASAATAIALLVGTIMYQDWRIDNLKAKASGYQDAISTLNVSLEKHEVAVSECRRIAAENFEESEKQRLKVAEAAERIKALESENARKLEDIADEESRIITEVAGECPAADDPDFLDWLYDSP